MTDSTGIACGGDFLLYQTKDGRTRIQCRFGDELSVAHAVRTATEVA